MKDRYILITGANGFVGNFITSELLKYGFKVKAFVRNGTSKKIINDNYTEIKADLRDYDNLREIIRNSNAIIHLACTRSNMAHEVTKDILGMIALVKNWLRGTFIFASSQDVYGIYNEMPISEDFSLNPCSWYGKGKAICERILLKSKNLKKGFVILRLPMIFGAHIRMNSSIVNRILSKSLSNEIFYLPDAYLQNDLSCGSSWIDVKNVSKFILRCLSRTFPGVFNIANGFVSWNELIMKIILLTNSKSKTEFVKYGVNNFSAPMYRLELNCERVRHMYGFSPSGKLEDSLFRMIQYKLLIKDLVLNENRESVQANEERSM